VDSNVDLVDIRLIPERTEPVRILRNGDISSGLHMPPE
jgi:hypothetical protein